MNRCIFQTLPGPLHFSTSDVLKLWEKPSCSQPCLLSMLDWKYFLVRSWPSPASISLGDARTTSIKDRKSYICLVWVAYLRKYNHSPIFAFSEWHTWENTITILYLPCYQPGKVPLTIQRKTLPSSLLPSLSPPPTPGLVIQYLDCSCHWIQRCPCGLGRPGILPCCL